MRESIVAGFKVESTGPLLQRIRGKMYGPEMARGLVPGDFYATGSSCSSCILRKHPTRSSGADDDCNNAARNIRSCRIGFGGLKKELVIKIHPDSAGRSSPEAYFFVLSWIGIGSRRSLSSQRKDPSISCCNWDCPQPAKVGLRGFDSPKDYCRYGTESCSKNHSPARLQGHR